MLHKPRGFITTMNDEKDRKCVAELVKELGIRVYPVGRLDKDSEGLLLMTNDGGFANLISHPSGHISKLYRVTVKPAVTEEILTTMSVGMMIDGVKTAPCTVRVVTEEKGRVVLEIVLNEGRNRQIRKMCEQLGLEVARLKRVAIGPLKLGMLQPGQYRDLTPEEKLKITASAKKAQSRNANAKITKENEKNDRNNPNGRPRRGNKNTKPARNKRR